MIIEDGHVKLADVAPDEAANSVAVRASGMTCDFGSGRGIFDVSFSLKWGSVLSLIGGNGSGKTTCLRCVALFQQVSPGGSLWLAGENWFGQNGESRSQDGARNPDRLRGRVVGTVFQQAEPWPHLNVLENVTLPLMLVGRLTQPEAKKRAEAALELFGVLERSRAMCHHLSGGLRQRVALARTFALQPRILLLDEITSALDPEWTERIRSIIRAFADAGGAVLNVSHRLGFVRRVSDQVLYLEEGRVVEVGPPAALLDSPKSENLRRFVENS